MHSKVPLPYGTSNFQGFPDFQKLRLWYTLSEMKDPLTAYIINNQCLWMPWKLLQGLADCIIDVYLPITQSVPPFFSLLVILTTLLSENWPHSVGWRHHVLHMHMPPYPLCTNASNDGYQCFMPGYYYILISWQSLVQKLTELLWKLTGCCGGGLAKYCA